MNGTNQPTNIFSGSESKCFSGLEAEALHAPSFCKIALDFPLVRDAFPILKSQSRFDQLKLASYLIFTRTLEIYIINPQFAQLATGALPWVKLDAINMKIAFDFYIEETEHAESSQDLCNLLFGEFNFKRFQSNFPVAVDKLFDLYKGRVERAFFDFACFISSECLISQSLSKISENKYDISIRDYLLKHARDEAEHRSFCLKLIANNKSNWEEVQINDFMSIGLEFARLFLTEDYQLLEDMQCGISKESNNTKLLDAEKTVQKLKITLKKAFTL